MMFFNNKLFFHLIYPVLFFVAGLLAISQFSHAIAADIKSMNLEIKELKQLGRTNQNDLNKQKALLENNSVKLFETLIRLEELDEQSVKYSDTLKTYGGQFESIDSRLNSEYKRQVLDTVNASGFWLFIGTLLAFVMPLGFIAFETGQIKTTELATAGMKHMMTWVIVFLVYFILGFGLMYGKSSSGLFGSTMIFMSTPDLTSFFNSEVEHIASSGGFLFFQIAFAMTAALIVSTALNNHFSAAAYGFIALCLAGLVYPLFGHWVWSSHLTPNNQGWLESSGFKDFAGSTAIHSVAAWFALVWIKGLKAKPAMQKKVASQQSSSNPLIYSLIGVYLLWFGWVGLVAGSNLKFDYEVIILVITLSLSGASAGLAAALASIFWGKTKILGGAISGFVAISAACDVVMPLEAIIIGSISGVIYQLGCSLLSSTLLKDQKGKTVGIISAHGICGVWGTLCVALFGTEGFLSAPDMVQLMIQFKGVNVALGFGLVSAGLCLLVYRVFSSIAGGKSSSSEEA